MRLSIIGSAGRKDDAPRMTSELYGKMLASASNLVSALKKTEKEVILVSGGAAWADHLAVSLFLKEEVARLELHFPCSFDRQNFCFADTGEFPNPGGTSNYYHKSFSAKMGGSSLRGIELALKKGAVPSVSSGFFERNKKVASSDMILAYTWGKGDVPADGGTHHTWTAARTERKTHVSLGDL